MVDLREDHLFQKEHIPSAINIPFSEIDTRYKELDRTKQIVFVCHTGSMGDESTKLLIKNGFKKVENLKGGMAQWTGPLTS
nr:rhodanese-like domain-containing protein [Bacillus solimangrovi]